MNAHSATISSVAFLLCLVAGTSQAEQQARVIPQVQVEEDVYTYVPPDNGAGPLWCFGSTCLVRIGNTCFASGTETIENQQPLNNVRWTLFQRGAAGWELQQKAPSGRTREPSPLAVFPDGPLFLSVNPTLTEPEATAGPARPEILEFKISNPRGAFERILPRWQDSPDFAEHSYRSFAADGPNRELILFQNTGYSHAEWSFRDRQGHWSANGQLKWPYGADYEKPRPIRVCYPSVMLKNRSVHFLGVSDIIEPNSNWRAYKKQLTGRDWDYDFRRLFYTWSPDITQGKFQPWIEIASRESTGGWISPRDLYVNDDGTVHLLWTERAIDTRLREEFFPDAKQSHAIRYAKLRDGEILAKRTLAIATEDGPQQIPQAGRFHITADHRLMVVYYVHGSNAAGETVSENRIMELLPDGSTTEPVTIPLQAPFTSFFTATPRAGSPLANQLDLLGAQSGKKNTISYACIQIK